MVVRDGIQDGGILWCAGPELSESGVPKFLKEEASCNAATFSRIRVRRALTAMGLVLGSRLGVVLQNLRLRLWEWSGGAFGLSAGPEAPRPCRLPNPKKSGMQGVQVLGPGFLREHLGRGATARKIPA